MARFDLSDEEWAVNKQEFAKQKREAAKQLQSYSLLRTSSERLDKRLAMTKTELDKIKLTVDGGLKHSLKTINAEISKTVAAAKTADEVLKTEINQATNTAKDALQILKNESSANRAITVGLDIVSAMRALRPLWSGENAVELLMQQVEVEHGHALMMAALIDLERQKPGTLKGRTLIEVGATRERAPAQKSTEKLAIFTAMTGMRFIAVDMDPNNIETLKPMLRYLNPTAQAIAEKGEEFLATYAGPIDYVYLDAFDFYHDNHSEARQDRYRKLLNTEINDQECWRMHLRCAELLIKRLSGDGIIVFDDTWTDDEGRYAGKGKTALPLFLKSGFHVVAATRATVALVRNSTDAP